MPFILLFEKKVKKKSRKIKNKIEDRFNVKIFYKRSRGGQILKKNFYFLHFFFGLKKYKNLLCF